MFAKMLSRPRSQFSLKGSIISAVVTTALAMGVDANANIVTWSISGPGTNSVTQDGNAASLSYSLSGPEVHTTQTWTATATAADAGNYAFNYGYTGSHAFFEASAFLNATSTSLGTVSLVDQTTSGSFDFPGSYTFNGVDAGDTLTFEFGGRNSDSEELLAGSLNLSQLQDVLPGPTENQEVPEPPTMAAVGVGLLAFVLSRRRYAKRTTR